MNSNLKGMKKRVSKAVILLENEAQVRDCLTWLNDIIGERVIIALTPFAMHELEKQEISYRIQEEYYDPQDIYSMGMANFQKVEELCSIIDGYITKSVPSANIKEITPALFSFYHLKMIYDAMTVRIFQLSSIFIEEKPDVVYIYATEKYPFGDNEKASFIQFDNRESIYAQILTLENWKINVKILQGGRKTEEGIEKKINWFNLNNIKIYISKHLHNPELMDLALIINTEGIPGVFKWFWYNSKPDGKRASVALVGGGYEWHESIMELRKRKISLVRRIRFDLYHLFNMKTAEIQGLDDAWNELLKNKGLLKLFTYKDINFFTIMESRLQFLVNKITAACITSERDAEKMIEKYNIKAIISPEITTCLDHSVARAAHNYDIPVITWQYGAYGGMAHPLLNYTDLISSDFHFVYGKGVEEQYIQAAKSYGTSLVSVGSATLDKLQERIPKENSELKGRKTVLYITNSYWQNSLYASFFPVFSDNLFWRTQKAIVAILRKYDKYSIIMKLHPSLLYMDPDIQSFTMDRGIKNFHIVKNEKSTVELLSHADIVVIDLPSTTLLQALTTTKPIFIYMGHMLFDKKAYQLLEKRAVCSEKIEDFIFELDDYLKNVSFRKDVDNQDFLKMFGTCEGSAAQRAVNKLREIIDNTR